MRAELRDAGWKKRLTAFNLAQTYFRKVSTDAAGAANILVLDLSRLRGGDWPDELVQRPLPGGRRALPRDLGAAPGGRLPGGLGDGIPEAGVRGLAFAAIGETGVW